MIDLERELHNVLTDPRHTLAAPVDGLDRVLSGVRRRRRRRRVAGSVAAAAVVLAGSAVAVQAPALLNGRNEAPTAATATMPWVDVTVEPPALARRAPRPDAPACDPADFRDLSTVDVLDNRATVLLGHSGTSRCSLRGTPVLVGTDPATGKRKTLATNVDDLILKDDVRQFPATVEPGERAFFDVTGCTGGRNYRDLAVRLGGRDLPITDVTVGTGCRAEVNDFHVQPPVLSGPLTYTMEAPTTAERGRYLDYTVTISNPTDRPYTFEQCPAYLQTLGEGGVWQQLNCGGRDIPAQGSARYAIRMLVMDAMPSSTRLRWLGVLSDGTTIENRGTPEGLPVEVR